MLKKNQHYLKDMKYFQKELINHQTLADKLTTKLSTAAQDKLAGIEATAVGVKSTYRARITAMMGLVSQITAKDIVQETMITIWKTIKKIKSPGSFMSWLYRIVVNKCFDQLRKRKRKS
jgi:DNA-directed RNA polymerase specialized sigma24 family protein